LGIDEGIQFFFFNVNVVRKLTLFANVAVKMNSSSGFQYY
jgi:hypothetical protein